jgi:UDP-glucuronate decarboxylase
MACPYNSWKWILVTGDTSFLGSHLVDRLLDRGHEAICADTLLTGTKRNIEHFHNHLRFECLRQDVTLPLYFEVDESYHLACPIAPEKYQHDPEQTHQDLSARGGGQHVGIRQEH